MSAFNKQLKIKNSRGVTLMELMVVIGVMAAIFAAAGQSLTDIVNKNAQVSAVNSLISTLSAARALAVTQRRSIIVQTDDQVARNWARGITVGNDEFRQEFQNDGLVITAGGALESIEFDPKGRAIPATTFDICYLNPGQNTGFAYRVQLSAFGMARALSSPLPGNTTRTILTTFPC